MRRLGIAVLLLSCVSTLVAADDVARLLTEIRGSHVVIDQTRELTDKIGGRPTGSPACVRAEEWAAAKLRAAGVDDVRLERYVLPATWRSDAATASCLSPEAFPLRIVACPLTVSTPKGEALEATLVDFGDGSPEALAKVPPSKGKIAFVHSAIMKSLDDLFGDYFRVLTLLDAAHKSGVAAMLIESSQPRSLLYRHPVSFDGEIVKLPVAIVAHDQSERMVRLMESGQVRVRIRLVSKIKEPATARNVAGTIRGTDKSDEIVIFGAHLDSWDLGTGALDNGVNSATVIDLARAIRATGLRPRRTIRFVLFTGEEQGMIGSREYVRAHASELPKVVMMLTADIGSGKTTGFFLNGREDLRRGVEEALGPIYSAKEQQNPIDGIDGTDNFDFLISGVPNLVANQDPVPYLPEYHAESDTFDKVDTKQAIENEAIDAAIVWYFANTADRLPRQNRAEVEKLLADNHLVEQMKAFQQWDEWVGGKRGLGK
ncbi:MAG TPA: M28 family peptidase [Thermoanaerobaculia bacterium]|nr:M28 family peptidase [Thermoanaerobaculia bacterium]